MFNHSAIMYVNMNLLTLHQYVFDNLLFSLINWYLYHLGNTDFKYWLPSFVRSPKHASGLLQVFLQID